MQVLRGRRVGTQAHQERLLIRRGGKFNLA